MDEEKDNLLYRPDLKPERDYLSDGSFTHTDVPAVRFPEDKKDDTPKRLQEDFQEIEEIIRALPPEVHFLAKSIEKIKKRIEIIYPDGYIPIEPDKEILPNNPSNKLSDEANIIGHIAIKDNPALSALPELFPKTNNVVLVVEQPKTLVQLVQNSYAKDQVELDKYYSQQLQIIMQKYFQQMLALMNDCGASSIDDLTKDFDGDFVKIPSGQDLEHLRDYIVRSQVQRKQQARLFRKTHSVDKTLMHMRAWHAAEAQRERYYGEKYKDSSTYTDSHSNALLRESRSMYDAAYSSSFYNMYKYLNSSVMMTNEILNATVKEAQAKAELLKNGVNIYAVNPEMEEFTNMASNSGQMGDGKGSGWDESTSEKSSDSSTSEKSDDASDSKSSDNESKSSDSQYENDLKYLKDNGYSEEAAKAELAKLENKSTTSDNSESSNSTGGLFGDLTKSLNKTVTGALQGMAKDVMSGKSISEAAKDAVTNVQEQVKSTVQSTAKGVLQNAAADGLTTGFTFVSDTIDKIESYNKKKKTEKVDKKNDASKYPVYNQFSADDDKLEHDRKRVAQIKQELNELNKEIAQIQKERKEQGKPTYRHNAFVELNKQKKQLQDEYSQLTK